MRLRGSGEDVLGPGDLCQSHLAHERRRPARLAGLYRQATSAGLARRVWWEGRRPRSWKGAKGLGNFMHFYNFLHIFFTS